jgi:ribose transport system substrate-binding protein
MLKRCMILVSLVALSGCGGSDPTAGNTPDDAPKVALIMKSLANEFFKTMEDSAREYHGENIEKFEFIANGIKNEEDVSGQITLVEQMMAQGVDALVITPANSQALVPVLKRAMEQGIVVVNIDNKLDGDTLAAEGVKIPFIGPDNHKGAKLAGDHLATLLSKGDEVAIIGGVPSSFNAQERARGFQDAMDDAGIVVVASQAANWEMSKANQIASGIVNEYVGLDAILCANDNMALGALAAVRDAGKQDSIRVVGFDSISAVQELILKDRIVCTVDQHSDQLAIFGIEYALEIMETGITPEDKETPVDLVTAETLRQ